jgi:WhiB family transcriptional regulator, redox-sensing transcriptional regulator
VGSDDRTWLSAGRCREMAPEVFFPNDGPGVRLACSICADCSVKTLCLEYALKNRITEGVWGGTSVRERRRMLRLRRDPHQFSRREDTAAQEAAGVIAEPL